MNGFEKFQKACSESIKPILQDMYESHSEDFAKVVENYWFDLEGPKTLKEAVNISEPPLIKLLMGYFEILESYQCLSDFELYFRRFPSKTMVTKYRYLKFLVDSYLNESYILEQRLSTFLVVVKKTYIQNQLYRNLYTVLTQLQQAVDFALKNIHDVRGAHVHQKRYSDNHLEMLSVFESTALNNDNEGFNRLYKLGFKYARDTWLKKIQDLNRLYKTILDYYFDELYKVIVDERNLLVAP